MVTLKDLQEYCNGKKIIIVGNSSRLLDGPNRQLIDNYDIVVRINRGYMGNNQYYNELIGHKTHIVSIGVQSATGASLIIQDNTQVNFILSPITFSEDLKYLNSYKVEKETYQELKKELSGFKPSTGIATYNFFNRFINFERLDLIGFDFFASSSKQRNQLGHTFVDDHNGIKEMRFFENSKDPDKTILHNHLGSPSPALRTINNVPIISKGNTNKYTLKKLNRR